ncbi:MAG: hypothetical protein QXN67_00740 [Thermoproteota archaeon]
MRSSVSEGRLALRPPWGLLSIFSARAKEIKGSTRLEKLLFLLKYEQGLNVTPYYDFTPYKKGPFSQKVIDDAKELERAGLIKITEQIFEPFENHGEYFIRRDYMLSSIGSEIAEKIFENLQAEIRLKLKQLEKFNKMSFQELLEYVYKKYPEFARYYKEVGVSRSGGNK